jgi:hypothetical protein
MPALGALSSLATSCAVGVASDLAAAPDDRSRMLPVHPAIAGLLPWGGLRRGATVVVRGSTSLLFALLARATETGSWAALVGMPNLGLRAAAELGVAVERLALVRHPGTNLPKVVAALLDGVDLVAVDPTRLADAQLRRLSARARHRGAVLVSTGSWPGADLELTKETAAWTGLGDGHGHLSTRETKVRARGRGAASRPTETWLHLPTTTGTVADALRDPFGTLPVPKGPLGAHTEEPDPTGTLTTLPAPRDAATAAASKPSREISTVPKGPLAAADPTHPDAAKGTLATPTDTKGSLAAAGSVHSGGAKIPLAAAGPACSDVAKGTLASSAAPKGSLAAAGSARADVAKGALATLAGPKGTLATARPVRPGAVQDPFEAVGQALAHDDPCVIDFALGPPSAEDPVLTGRGA